MPKLIITGLEESNMKLRRLYKTLERHERFMPKAYKDSVGKTTIGIGRNLDDKGITRDEAMLLLANDVREVTEHLKKKYYWFSSLDDVRQEVVTNMCFNLGEAGFAAFKKTIGYIEEGEFSMAAAEMLDSLWADQVGYRAQELARAMASGLWE